MKSCQQLKSNIWPGHQKLPKVYTLGQSSAFEHPEAFGEHLEQDFNFWELLGNFWEPAVGLPGAFGEHLEQDFNFWELLGNFWDSKTDP